MLQNTTNIQNAILDMTKSLRDVFKQYSRDTRKIAWKRLSDARGQKEMVKILDNPNRNLNTFQKLAFKEWFNNN